jgi:aspartyl-tRNA(Asn)/glutamyl-tRNA(Gln) amidotransferase subunit C
MSLTEKDVDHVARLARLALQAEERKDCREQLERILGYMKNLEKYDVSGVAPTSHVVPISNMWREDEARPFSDTEAILANAPDREDAFFKVKKVIE